MSDLSIAAREMMADKKMSEELVRQEIANLVKAAYRRQFGLPGQKQLPDDELNCEVEIDSDFENVTVYQTKTVVADGDVFDTLSEIGLKEAQEYGEYSIGDTVGFMLDPRTFTRVSIHSGKQCLRQRSSEIRKDTVFNQFSAKRGQIIVGYIRVIDHKKSVIRVDLGDGVDGILPKKFQNPIESYQVGDKIQVFIQEVNKKEKDTEIVLSRTSKEFVAKLFYNLYPEIQDKDIHIYNIARRPGYKTKIAVYTEKPDLDPVGTCIGPQGSRIKMVINELGGEKIDIIPYTDQVEHFIAAALSPADVKMVNVVNAAERRVFAVVDPDQLGLAIGKEGVNISLADKLTDWEINVMTEEEYKKQDFVQKERARAEEIFAPSAQADESEDEVYLKTLDIPSRVLKALKDNGVDTVDKFADWASEVDYTEALSLTEEEDAALMKALSPYIDFESEDAE